VETRLLLDLGQMLAPLQNASLRLTNLLGPPSEREA
jgi:hypothetical protein